MNNSKDEIEIASLQNPQSPVDKSSTQDNIIGERNQINEEDVERNPILRVASDAQKLNSQETPRKLQGLNQITKDQDQERSHHIQEENSQLQEKQTSSNNSVQQSQKIKVENNETSQLKGQNQQPNKSITLNPSLPKPKEPFCLSTLFFCQFNSKIKRASQRGKQKQALQVKDLGSLPGPMLVNSVVEQFENIREKFITKKLAKPGIRKQPSRATSQVYANNHESQQGRLNDQLNAEEVLAYELKKPLFKLIMPTLFRACLYKTIEQGASYLFVIILKEFVKELRVDVQQSRRDYWHLLYVLAATSLIFVLGVFNEHASFNTAKSKAKAGQALRGLFFQKFKEANYLFLHEADTSFVSKMLFYEIDRIIQFIGIIPSLVSAPFALIAAFTFVFLEIGLLGFVALAIVIILLVILVLLNQLLVKKRHFFSKKGSKRATILNEIVPNMHLVKINSMESYFQKMLTKIRIKENNSLAVIHFIQTLMDFLMVLMPLICSFLSIALFNSSNATQLTGARAFSLVTIFTLLSSPFNNISKSIDDLAQFTSSAEGFRLFLDKVTRKTEIAQVSKRFDKAGGILLQNYSAFIDTATPKMVFKTIYGIKEAKEQLKRASIANPSQLSQMQSSSKMPLNQLNQQNSNLQMSSNMQSNLMKQKGINVIIKDMNLEILPGQKIALTGKEGSGRSIFLLSLIGETETLQGSIHEQTGKSNYLNLDWPSWVSGTLQKNITLDFPLIKSKFDEIVKLVGLELENFGQGQEYTEVLEHASNFSNTERKQILLARMLYTGGDIFMFDDFFDELNDSIKLELFQKVVLGYLQDKTVIYMTMNNSMMAQSDKVLVLKQSRVNAYDHFDALSQNQPEDSVFKEIINMSNQGAQSNGQEIITTKDIQQKQQTVSNHLEQAQSIRKMSLISQGENAVKMKSDLGMLLQEKKEKKSQQSGLLGNMKEGLKTQKKKSMGKRIETEKIILNAVSAKTLFSKYLVNRGIWGGFLIFFLFFVSSLALLVTDMWLGVWSSKSFQLSDDEYLYTYLALAVGSALFIIPRDFVFRWYIRSNLNKRYYDLFDLLVHSKTDFFSRFPTSRIVYRLTKDQLVVDEGVLEFMIATLQTFFLIIGAVIITGIVSFGTLFVAVGICIIIILVLVRRASRARTTFQQLSAGSKQDLVHSFLQILECIMVLRSIGQTNFFDSTFRKSNNAYQLALTHTMNFTGRWIGIRMVYINTSVIFVAFLYCSFAIQILPEFFKQYFWTITLTIAWSRKIVSNLSKMVPSFMGAHTSLLSLARIEEYKQYMKRETLLEHQVSDLHKKAKKNKTIFTHQKKIKLQIKQNSIPIQMVNATLRFKSGQQPLTSINFMVKKRQRIGIIGKSGSGKHSIFKLLLALENKVNEPGSKIELFDHPIEHLDPFDVRQKILFLKESAMMFIGTVRTNMDPSNKFSDQELIKVLHYLKLFELKHEEDFLHELGTVSTADVFAKIGKKKQMFDGIFDVNLYDKGKVKQSFNQHLTLMTQQDENGDDVEDQQYQRENQIDQDSFQSKESESEEETGGVTDSKTNREQSEVSRVQINSLFSGFANKLNLGKDELIQAQNKKGGVRDFMKKMKLERELEIQIEEQLKKEEEERLLKESDEGKEVLQEFENYKISNDEERQYILDFLNQKVNQQGRGFGEGEKKIINAARAFLDKPEILLLDENALDLETLDNSFFFEALWKHLKDSTIVTVLSGFDNIQRFDWLIYLEKGKITEQGTPQEMIKQQGWKMNQMMKKTDPQLHQELTETLKQQEESMTGAGQEEAAGLMDLFGNNFKRNKRRKFLRNKEKKIKLETFFKK